MIRFNDGSVWEWPVGLETVTGDPMIREVESHQAFIERAAESISSAAPVLYSPDSLGRHRWKPANEHDLFKKVSRASTSLPWGEVFLMPWGHVYVLYEEGCTYDGTWTCCTKYDNYENYLAAVTIP